MAVEIGKVGIDVGVCIGMDIHSFFQIQAHAHFCPESVLTKMVSHHWSNSIQICTWVDGGSWK